MNFQPDLFLEMTEIAARGRWPSTSIILGSEGHGPLLLFRDLAKTLLCKVKEEGFCDQCRDCKRMNQWSHPNVLLEFPMYGSKESETHLKDWREWVVKEPFGNAIDWLQFIQQPASRPNYSAKSCRSIIDKLGLANFEKNYRILFLWEADYLGKEGNILLKTIEEPPENTFVVLTSKKEEELLNTIRSRAQTFRLKRIPRDRLSQYLEKEKGLGPEQAGHLAFLADGSVRDAAFWADQAVSESASYFVNFMRQAYKGDPYELKKITDEAARNGKNYIESSFEFGLKYIEAMLRFNFEGKEDSIHLEDEIKLSAKKLSAIMDLTKLDKLKKLIEHLILGVQRNANKKLILYQTALDVNYILRRK
jgi:DNA polymerase-3 subunit delta'